MASRELPRLRRHKHKHLGYVRLNKHDTYLGHWSADEPPGISAATLRAPMDDDEAALTHYVWEHHQDLMTDFERRVGRAILGREKAAVASSPSAARLLHERWGKAGDPDIEAALGDGSEAYRRRVCRRVLTEHGATVHVNRCPACSRVVRTPPAQQCVWCPRLAWTLRRGRVGLHRVPVPALETE
jgi:hypothetical protein